MPEGFDRAKSSDLLTYSSELAKKQKKSATPRKATTETPRTNEWTEWRRQVTQALDLRRVYGRWLTGKKGGKGWLQCRLADSDDPHPSAGVADSARNAERGTYHNMVTGESIRLIDFMTQFGIATDIKDANRLLSEWTGVQIPLRTKQEARPSTPPPPPDDPPPPEEEVPEGSDDPPERPSIVVNGRQVRDVIKEAWEALLPNERPKIYVRNGELVRIKDGEFGKRINPMVVEGQVHGATGLGIGAALKETFEYDEDGQLLNSNFLFYHAATAMDVPNIKTSHIESPSPFTGTGAKGMGEGGGAPLHTISAAIQDAIGPGKAIVSDSHNPPEREWRMLNWDGPAEERGVTVVSNGDGA